MSYQFTSQVQWIKRSKVSSGSDYRGTGWVDSEPVTVAAIFAPAASNESTLSGDTVTTQPTLYEVDPALGVTAVDRFLIGGDQYEVTGDPQVFPPNPWSGHQHGAVITLRKVTG